MGRAEDQELVAGSSTSAEGRVLPLLMPPATTTLPEGSKVAVWALRYVAMEAAEVRALVAGSYTSTSLLMFLIGSDTTAPYSLTWRTQGVPSGHYTLTAKAYDSPGNEKVSTGVNVIVH
jgi:hypothetical protein